MDQIMIDEFKDLPKSILEQEFKVVDLEVEKTILEEELSLVINEVKSMILEKASLPEFKQQYSNAEKRDLALKQELKTYTRYNVINDKIKDLLVLLRTSKLNLSYSKRMFRMYESLSRC